MANTLLINKLTGGYFQFVLNGDTANAVRGIKNDLLAVGEQLHFKTGNGANIIKEQFIYPADLTIVASGTFTFSTVDQVWTKLIEIGYFDWINSGGSGTGASRFDDLLDTFKYTGKDGQVVIVNESQQKLQTIPLYNYRKFTDLEDTPDLLLANKMVATNEAGTALIFKNLPEDPVNYLNSIGFFDYNDLATQTTAISVTANTDTKLTNDTLGAYTNINYPPYGVSSLWDATTNRFNFSQLSIGDTIDVRVHLQVTTTTSNQTYKIGAKFGIGSASAFDNIIFTDQAKNAGIHEVSFVAPFYIGEANILNNPAELYINTDASATVKVDGWYIRVLRRNINIVNVETGVDDATTTVKGILRLAGDLAGTATNPTVPALADKALKSTTITINGTTFDLSANREWTISADATWGGIGGLLSNQTDLQSALNLKANDNAVVKLTGNQSITGIKTFTTVSGNALTINNPTGDWGQVINNTSTGQGLQINNSSTGVGLVFLSSGTSTGNIITHQGIDGLLKFRLNSTGDTTANSFIKSGGTAAQILAADGSVITAGTNITISGGVISASGGSTGSLEFNATDLTVWNNGNGNIATNTSFGDGALKSNTTGNFNTALGGSSLENNTNGGANVSVGSLSMRSNTSGGNNVAVGMSALISNTSGGNNAAFGTNALSLNTTGLSNTAIGTQAGSWAGASAVNNTDSTNSVFVGSNTRPLADGQTNQIVIGNGAIGHGSNTVTLGNSSIVTTILRGNVGIGITTPATRLEVLGGSDLTTARIIHNGANGGLNIQNIGSISTDRDAQIRLVNGSTVFGGSDRTYQITNVATSSTASDLRFQYWNGSNYFPRFNITSGGNVVINNLGTGTVYSNAGTLTNTNPSDERLKENITDLGYGLNEILQLRPVSYNWINDTANQGTQFGFIAQEVQEIMPELINEFTITEDDEEVVRLGLDKEAIFVTLVNAIKELKAEINVLKN